MHISEIIGAYVAGQPAGIVLEPADIGRLLRKAVRLYCGYAALKNLPAVPVADGGDGIHSPFSIANESVGDQDVLLTHGEFAIISPLWNLYIEFENATHLEASRDSGIETWGRTASEIKADIDQMEASFPNITFSEMPETI